MGIFSQLENIEIIYDCIRKLKVIIVSKNWRVDLQYMVLKVLLSLLNLLYIVVVCAIFNLSVL